MKKLKFNYKNIPDIADPLVVREINDMLFIQQEVNISNMVLGNKEKVEKNSKIKSTPESIDNTVTTVIKSSGKEIQPILESLDY